VDVDFHYDGQRFVWDTQKADVNKIKHGTAFEQACSVFFDPFAAYEDASINAERRQAAIGHSEDSALLFVVHLVQEDDAIRIISAREATREERRLYEDYDGTD
jgi:uncharacterized DUF497 family protein